jgi:hypothetical protein
VGKQLSFIAKTFLDFVRKQAQSAQPASAQPVSV